MNEELYTKLYSRKLITGDYDTFRQKYGTPEGSKKLFDKLQEKKLYTKSYDEFLSKYLPPAGSPIESLRGALELTTGRKAVSGETNSDIVKKPTTPVKPVINMDPIIQADMIKFGVYDENPDELKSVWQEDVARRSAKKTETLYDLPPVERDNIFNESKKLIEDYYDSQINRLEEATHVSEKGISSKVTEDPVANVNRVYLKNQKLTQLNNLESQATAYSVLSNMAEVKSDFDYNNTSIDDIRKNAIRVGIATQFPTQQTLRDNQQWRADLLTDPLAVREAKKKGINPTEYAMDSTEYAKNLFYGLQEKKKWTEQNLESIKKAQKEAEQQYQEYVKNEVNPILEKIKEIGEENIEPKSLKNIKDEINKINEQFNKTTSDLNSEELKLNLYNAKLDELFPEAKSYADWHEYSKNQESLKNIQTDVLTHPITKKFGYGLLDWATSIGLNLKHLGADVMDKVNHTSLSQDLQIAQALKRQSEDALRKQHFNLPEQGYKNQEFARSDYIKDKEGNITGVDFNFDFTSLPYLMTKTYFESYGIGAGGALAGKAASYLPKLAAAKFANSAATRLAAMGVEKTAQFIGMYPATYILFGQEIFENELLKTQDPELAKNLTLLRVAIETASELLNPLEIDLYRNSKGLLADITTEQAEKISLKLFNSPKYAKLVKTLTLSKVAGKEFATMSGMEYLEEAMANIGNFTVDQFQSDSYKKENELSLQNEFLTAINTIATMGLLGGVQASRSVKNAKTTSQFIIGKLADNFHQKNQELFKSGRINQKTLDEREEAVAKAQTAYQGVKQSADKFENIIKKSNTGNLPETQKEMVEAEMRTYSDNMAYLLFQNHQKLNELSQELLKQTSVYVENAPSSTKKNITESEMDKIASEMEAIHKKNKSIESTAVKYLETLSKIANRIASPEVQKAQREQSKINDLKNDANPIVTAVAQSDEELNNQTGAALNVRSSEEEQDAPSETIINATSQIVTNTEDKKAELTKEEKDAKLYSLAQGFADGKTEVSEEEMQLIANNHDEFVNLVAQFEPTPVTTVDPAIVPVDNIASDAAKLTITPEENANEVRDQKQVLKNEEKQSEQLVPSENEDAINSENTESVENTIQKNKLIGVRELISDNIHTIGLKIVDAFSSFATQMREFATDIKEELGIAILTPISDELNPKYIKLLSKKLYTSGTPIKFVVRHDDDSDYITESRLQFLKNAEDAFNSDYLNKKDYVKDEYFIPIEIQDEDNNVIGYVHSLDYIRPDRVVTTTDEESTTRDNLIRNYNDLKSLRKKIISLSKKNSEVKSVITTKSDGHLSIRSDRKYIPIREAFNNQEVISSLTLSNNQEWAEGISRGRPIVAVQTINGKLAAIGLKREQITRELAISAKVAIRAFMNGDSSIRDIIYDKLNIDIGSAEGLQKYLNLIVYTNTDRRAMFGTSQIDARLRANVPFVSFDIGSETIYFSTQRIIRDDTPIDPFKLSPPYESLDAQLNDIGVFRIKLNPDKPLPKSVQNELLLRFEKTLQSLHLNFNDKAKNDRTGDFTLLLFNEDNKINENPKFDNSGKSYTDFIIKHLYTNVLEHKIEYQEDGKNKVEYSYFEQPTVQYDVNLDKYNRKPKVRKEAKATKSGLKIKEDTSSSESVKIERYKTGKNKGDIKQITINPTILEERYKTEESLLTFEEFVEEQVENTINEQVKQSEVVPPIATVEDVDDLFGDLSNIPGAEPAKQIAEKRNITDKESEDINRKCNDE